MSQFADADERRRIAQQEYGHIMTTPAPGPTGAYIETGVIGYVFGEMWRRGVLTARDRRWITLTCVGAAGAPLPIETHVWAALKSGDVSYEEFDEFVLHFATQLGWPKASVMQTHGLISLMKLVEENGTELTQPDFETWLPPVTDEARRARGIAGYETMMGTVPPEVTTPFGGRARLDFLYGEICSRETYLSRRDRRLISICGAAACSVDDEVREQLEAALRLGDLSREELEELVMHYTVYLGWNLGRRLDDILSGSDGSWLP